jgi:hypothetical protein
MSETVTVVFEGDVSSISGNPFKVECPFGRVVAISVNDVIAESDRFRAALEGIRARRYQNRETVSPDNAFEAFGRLSAEVCAIYSECDAALSGDKHE